jgi:hypothetical protein
VSVASVTCPWGEAPRNAGCRVRFRQTWCGFELPHHLADRRIESADPETGRIAAKYLESNYLPRTASLSLQLRAPDQTGTPLAVDSHEETSRPNAGRAHWPSWLFTLGRAGLEPATNGL